MQSGWSSDRDLLLELDRAVSPRESIERSVRQAIRDGRLTLGALLPSSRSLAGDLGVARGTVSAAYAQLLTQVVPDGLLQAGRPADAVDGRILAGASQRTRAVRARGLGGSGLAQAPRYA